MSGFKKVIDWLRHVPTGRLSFNVLPPSRIRKYTDVQEVVPDPDRQNLQNQPVVLQSIQMQQFTEDDEQVVLDEFSRLLIINLMTYYEFLHEKTNEFDDDPDHLDRVQELKVMAANDMPIKKGMLMQMAPEFFVYELMQKQSPIALEEKYKNLGLTYDEKKKRIEYEMSEENALVVQGEPHIARISPPQRTMPRDPRNVYKGFYFFDMDDPGVNYLDEYYHISEINRRHWYIWKQIQKQWDINSEILLKYIDKIGTVDGAVKFIRLKPQEMRTAQEQQVLDSIDYMERLGEEYEEFVKHVKTNHAQTFVFDFPMSDHLKEMFMNTVKQIVDNQFVDDMAAHLQLPDLSDQYQKELEIKQQKIRDALLLEEKERKLVTQAFEKGGDELLERRDFTQKDNDLIRKMNMLADMVVVEKSPEIQTAQSDSNYIDRTIEEFKKASGIGIEEDEVTAINFVKILFLNNHDPQQFNLDYWQKKLNIKKDLLQRMFYTVSLPVVMNGEIIGKLDFQDTKNRLKPWED